jgi:glycerol-3-phosphate O-acyltransferase/dihydroxyacetone phosphate acyltransferase
MLYRLVKSLMRLAIGMFYRQTMFRNMHHIPAKGPALLIANHPSSLMDAAILGVLLKRPVHFFARGDIFIHPMANRLLNALHMHPVHHHRMGRQSLGSNDGSFRKAIELLSEGELVLFFPEGSSHVDYTLHNFKKGAFRIALRTISENPSIQLPIVPLGLNYSQPTNLFSRFWVQAGPPILVKEFYGVYQERPALTTRLLTEKAYSAVQNLVIQTSPDLSANLFHVMEIWRNADISQTLPASEIIEEEILFSQATAKRLHEVEPFLKVYLQDLASENITDASVAASSRSEFSATPLIMGFPAALIGWILNGLPLLIARSIADKKVKRVDFYSWILVTSSALLYLTWFLLLSLIAAFFLTTWKILAFLFIVIATGQYSWNYFSYYSQWKIQQKGKKLPDKKLEHLSSGRNKILEIILNYKRPSFISATTAGSSNADISPS